ncbi:hypothetical protein EYV94_20755 [Puteibacter caeruleilacunae]|nr:hypothetical protein EYV94_20755 [Puteibacter caeruleilacunae]
MAKGLDGHTVSLTKNGYFKLAKLIRRYKRTEILDNLAEINLNFTQARKMLAGRKDNHNLPEAWDTIKDYNEPALYSLLLFSIIFSHKNFITLFKNATNAEMKGAIKRDPDDVKTYTNLAYALNEGGLATDFSNGANITTYDLSPIFIKNEIGPLAKEVLTGHLKNMGWNEPNKDEPFNRTFYEVLKGYEFNRVLGVSFEQFKDWLEGKNVIRNERSIEKADVNSFIDGFIENVKQTGLSFSDKLITRFISSLATKPFVILTGLSGSGKTKLAQAFTEWICSSEDQYCIVPVGADWTNREPLLGYPNALKSNEYKKPDCGALDLIIRADKNRESPYFLILDEMNLSHVERYFADFLSVMESKESIPLFAEGVVENGVPSNLRLPENLFIIGTVNIDETTYMFSPKVLDRANVIEFRVTKEEIEDFFTDHKTIQMDLLSGEGKSFENVFLELARNSEFKGQDLSETNRILVKFFEQLKKTGAEFGYRTASEIFRLINQLSIIDPNLSAQEKVDIAIMQKLLPKLHGSRRKLSPVLINLGDFCIDKEKIDNVEKSVFTVDDFDYNSEGVEYPLSLEKISRMYKGAIDNGFASYAEA